VILRLVVAATAAITLAGCAGTPPTPGSPGSDDAWSMRRAALSGIDAWEIRGRLAVQTAEQAETVSFVWRRNARHHEIEMFGIFGGGRVRMTEDPGRATFVDRKGATAAGTSAETLFFAQTGWHIPFDAIVHWAVGLPDPAHPYVFELDPQGRLLTLQQLGWHVSFIDYLELGAYEVPRKVFAERSRGDTESGGLAKVRLAIKRWQLPGIVAAGAPPARNAPREN